MKNANKRAERVAAFMPNGIPRYIRIYDNGGESADRYTVCYTGRYRKFNKERREWDWWQYVGMSENPFFHLGICQHGESAERIDQPSYKHLGKRIKFADLPRDCQAVVLSDYREIWNF